MEEALAHSSPASSAWHVPTCLRTKDRCWRKGPPCGSIGSLVGQPLGEGPGGSGPGGLCESSWGQVSCPLGPSEVWSPGLPCKRGFLTPVPLGTPQGTWKAALLRPGGLGREEGSGRGGQRRGDSGAGGERNGGMGVKWGGARGQGSTPPRLPASAGTGWRCQSLSRQCPLRRGPMCAHGT